VSRSYGYDGARLVPLAPGEAASFLGFQVPQGELGKGIRAFRHGMGQLVDALVRAIAATGRVDVRLGARVLRITSADPRWTVVLEDGTRHEIDAVVMAAPASAAATMLEGELGEVARAIGRATTQSSCTVTLAYPREAIEHPLDGTGFVVAAAHQEHGFRATTFITSKFPARAPEGHASLRIFFRPEPEDLATLRDEAWTTRAEDCLGRVLPVRGRAARAWVSRWGSALPVFEPGHIERVRALEAALAGRRVLLAGSAFHGSGIDAAVRSAAAAATALSE
jgi:oxygen-dependent protoporphyrinogen oxidase